MDTKIAWNRTSEALLLELVREKRFLWDPKDPLYHKTKLRQEAFKSIAEALTLQCPELSQLNGDQVRIKFKNLRTYFLNQHRKIRDAPSGSAGCPEVKWPLFGAATFLLDTEVDLTPSKSTFELPSNMVEGTDVGLVTQVSIGEGVIEEGFLLEEQRHTSGDEQQRSRSSSQNLESPTPSLSMSVEERGSSKSGTSSSETGKRKRGPKSPEEVDTSLSMIGKYLESKQSTCEFAVHMGGLVESTANQLSFPKQVELLKKITKAIEEVTNENN